MLWGGRRAPIPQPLPRSMWSRQMKRSIQEAGNDVDIYSININSKITSRFAHNVIESRAVNRANISKEVFFDVDLPKTAFITNFSMVIDGITYLGEIKEKEVAKKQYDTAVSRGQTAGLVRASGRKTEKFSVSVNIASESKVTFQLTYEEMLKRSHGKYEAFIKVKPKNLVKNFKIEVDIYEPQGISFLDAAGTFITNELQPVIKKTIAGKKGHVIFNPTIDEQRSCTNCTNTLLDGDFTVTYDVNRETPGNIQIVNGYFVHFFAPPKLPGVPKNVVFVIDRSGSMYGLAMRQTIEALLKILSDLKENDHFNFLIFDGSIDTWKKHLVKATPENVKEARYFVGNITARGMTNINDATLKAVELLNAAQESNYLPARSVSLIILLTDGDANVGVSIPEKIQQNVKNAIQGKYTLYCLGFGTSLDYGFLEKMALENSGVARRIYADADAALQLQGFYDEVANPILMNIEVQYPENAVSDVTKNSFKHYFDGSEIVVAGRIIDNDLNTFTSDVKAEGSSNSLNFIENVDLQEKSDSKIPQDYIFGEFTERLWAYLTIQQLLEKRTYAKEPEKSNLTAEILELSLNYKFVTPLTSMVVTKPEEKDKTQDTLIADKFVDGAAQSQPSYPSSMSQSSQSSPSYAQNYRYPQTYVDSDPHFVIQVPEKKDALCFNIQEAPGVVLNLIKDPVIGITVNGELIGNKKVSGNLESNQTYFGKFGIINTGMDLKIEVNTDKIIVWNGEKKMIFSWQETIRISENGLDLLINKKKNVLLSMGEGARFVIILHKVWKNHPLHKDFLGFYTLDSHRFSTRAHGLLGQFFHGIDYEISNVHKISDPQKPDATMFVKNNMLTVNRGVQKDYRMDARDGSKVPCWFVHHDGHGLIDGNHSDYIVPNLFSTE
uniref:Inter-alpha-trypsin inhibitor heavy chain H3 n=1 Tax=Leptobrachium leishanense TaxID=445787 RepID=A0A8C5QGJ4_9ANUR